MPDQTVEVGVKVTADVAAADRVVDALDRSKTAAKELEQAMAGISGPGANMDELAATAEKATSGFEGLSAKAKGLEEVLNKVGGRGAAANDVLESVSAVAKGSERSFLAAAKGLAGFIGVMSMGGVGMFLSALGLVVATVTAFITKSKEAKAAAEAMQKTFNECAEALQKYNDTPLDKLARGLKAINTEMTLQEEHLAKLLEREQKLAAAQFSKQRAEVDSDLSSGRISQTDAVKRQNAIAKAEQDFNANFPVKQAQAEADLAKEMAAKKQAVAEQVSQRVAQDMEGNQLLKPSELKKLLEDYKGAITQAGLARLQSTQYGGDGPMDPDVAQGLIDRANAKAAYIEKTLKGYGIDPNADSKEIQKAYEEDSKRRSDRQRELRDEERAANDEAQAAAEEAERRRYRAQDLAGTRSTVDPVDKKTLEIENETKLRGTLPTAAEIAAERKKLLEIQAANDAASQKRMEEGGGFGWSDEETTAYASQKKRLDSMSPKAPTNTGQKTYAPSTKAVEEKGKETDAAAKKVIDASEQAIKKVEDSTTKANESIEAAASSIEKTAKAIPPPVDVGPVVAAHGAYHSQNMEMHERTVAEMSSMAKQIEANARAIATLRSQLSSKLKKG